MSHFHWKKVLWLSLIVVCGLPFVNTAYALSAGIIFSLLVGNPLPQQSARWSKTLLQASVVGLGFGQSLAAVWQVGKNSIFYTLIGICLTLLIGVVLGRILGTEKRT